MAPEKFRTFALSFRPRKGALPSDITKLHAYCQKKCDYYAAHAEGDGDSYHLHLALFRKSACTRGQVVIELLRLFKDRLDETERQVFRTGIKIMYNEYWIEEYMTKTNEKPLFAQPPEAARIDAYFPTLKPSLTRATDAKYAHLEKLYRVHGKLWMDVTPKYMRDFLFDLMYNKRVIKVIKDDRTIIQTSRHLARYINHEDSSRLVVDPLIPDA